MIKKTTQSLSIIILVSLTYTCYNNYNLRADEMVGFERLRTEVQQDADLFLVDILHSFSFRFYNKSPYTLISRGYPCYKGRFWNAYGWNDCPDPYVKIPDDFISNYLNKDDFNKIVLITRGPFDKRGYPEWYELLLKEYRVDNVSKYHGPYVTVLKKYDN